MDTSDSEAFESADEDFKEDTGSGKGKPNQPDDRDSSDSSDSEQADSIIKNVSVDCPSDSSTPRDKPELSVTTLQSIDSELLCDSNSETQQDYAECHRVVKKSHCDFYNVQSQNDSTVSDIVCEKQRKEDSQFEVTALKESSETIPIKPKFSTPIELNTSTLSSEERQITEENDKALSSTLPQHENQESSSSKSYEVDRDEDEKIHVVESSGWEDDIEWTPVEDTETTLVEANSKKTTDGWDEDFDGWDTFDDTETEPKIETQRSENVSSLFEKLSVNQTNEKSSGWGGWGSWGVTSLISTATDSVQTFTSQVSQGLSTVLESSIGVPSPEDLARAQIKQQEKLTQDDDLTSTPFEEISKSEAQPTFRLGNLMTGVSHITKLVETTSSKVVNTGLDTLEVIGKKTMEVLQEGDPGLAKKRAMLGLQPEKPCLSQILREAKDKAETEDQLLEKKQEVKKVHFETLFDDHQGLIHLEALEILSKQCDIKLSTLLESSESSADALKELQETMVQVKELCELPDEEDDEQSDIKELKTKLDAAIQEIGVQISYDKLLNIWEESETAIKDVENEIEIHKCAIETLARITSVAVEQFHKCAELLLVKERRSTADEADSLVQLTSTLTALIGVVAAKFSEKLDSLALKAENPNLNSLITDVFFEATQSSSYVQDAFQLCVPILQVGAV